MFKDIKDLSFDKENSYDVCIVGSGPAGISVVKKLLNSKYKIALLESGGLYPEDDYQVLNEGKNSGPSFLSLDHSRMRSFGGAGLLWAGWCAPFESNEFEKKSFLNLSGWPISLKDLEIYYKEAAKILGISYDKFYDKKLIGETTREKNFKEFFRDESLLKATVFQVSSPENRNLAEKYRLDLENSNNTDVIFHSTVTNINLSDNGKDVDNVSISDLSGSRTNIKAKIFVLACGALENPRILLSSNKFYKNGIGNSEGLVGSCFMSHPGINNVGEIYKISRGKCFNGPKKELNYKVSFEISPKERFRQKILRHSLSIKNSDLIKKSDYSNFFLIMKKTFCQIIGKKYFSNNWNLTVGLEQPPTSSNYLKLDNKTDQLGIPKINMYWNKISSIERDTVIKSVDTMAKELGILNTGRIKLKEDLLSGKAFNIDDPINHHIGTTRMSDSYKTGVVDKNCKVFGLSNLYIAGSSVFATSSIVNPTYTIVALSLRLGEYLKKIKI